MEVKVSWQPAMEFHATTQSGHTIVMDGPEDHGGVNAGARPMELMLTGLAGCSSFDVVHILQKSRQDVRDCQAVVTAQRADTEPKVFTEIHLHFVVTGVNLKASAVERAVSLSAEKYCSASILMERAGVKVTHSHEVIESDAQSDTQ